MSTSKKSYIQVAVQSSQHTGILNTCTRLWLTESEQATSVVSIQDVVRRPENISAETNISAGEHIGRNVVEDNSPKNLNDKNQQASSQKFRQQTPEEGRRTYRPKRCGNNNKDEDNSPKNLNNKIYKLRLRNFDNN